MTEIHEKILELKKYFPSSNPSPKQQIQTFIEYYKQEARIKEEKNLGRKTNPKWRFRSDKLFQRTVKYINAYEN